MEGESLSKIAKKLQVEMFRLLPPNRSVVTECFRKKYPCKGEFPTDIDLQNFTLSGGPVLKVVGLF